MTNRPIYNRVVVMLLIHTQHQQHSSTRGNVHVVTAHVYVYTSSLAYCTELAWLVSTVLETLGLAQSITSSAPVYVFLWACATLEWRDS